MHLSSERALNARLDLKFASSPIARIFFCYALTSLIKCSFSQVVTPEINYIELGEGRLELAKNR